MTELILTSLLWGVSFGLIKAEVASLDPLFVSFARLALSFLVFLPLLGSRPQGGLGPPLFARLRLAARPSALRAPGSRPPGPAPRMGYGLEPPLFARLRLAARPSALPALGSRPQGARPLGLVGRLMGIGFVQFGLMYCLYISAYRNLAGHQVAVLTVTTPVLVVLIDAALERRWVGRFLVAAGLAVAGALVLVVDASRDFRPQLVGVALVQLANLCFAAGQLLYRRLVRHPEHGPRLGPAHRHFGWLYLGALLAPAALGLGLGALTLPERSSQWLALLYLGLVPSGLGFFLWNRGAARVNAGTVAAMNNLKVPAGVLIAWLAFGEAVDPPRLVGSLALLAIGVALTERRALAPTQGDAPPARELEG